MSGVGGPGLRVLQARRLRRRTVGTAACRHPCRGAWARVSIGQVRRLVRRRARLCERGRERAPEDRDGVGGASIASDLCTPAASSAGPPSCTSRSCGLRSTMWLYDNVHYRHRTAQYRRCAQPLRLQRSRNFGSSRAA
jgi:hypothetical protein